MNVAVSNLAKTLDQASKFIAKKKAEKEAAEKAERAAARSALASEATSALADTLRQQQDELAAALAQLQARLDAAQAAFVEAGANGPTKTPKASARLEGGRHCAPRRRAVPPRHRAPPRPRRSASRR